jgi:hypothetical protein
VLEHDVWLVHPTRVILNPRSPAPLSLGVYDSTLYVPPIAAAIQYWPVWIVSGIHMMALRDATGTSLTESKTVYCPFSNKKLQAKKKGGDRKSKFKE